MRVGRVDVVVQSTDKVGVRMGVYVRVSYMDICIIICMYMCVYVYVLTVIDYSDIHAHTELLFHNHARNTSHGHVQA